jgi:hypothetical protein
MINRHDAGKGKAQYRQTRSVMPYHPMESETTEYPILMHGNAVPHRRLQKSAVTISIQGFSKMFFFSIISNILQQLMHSYKEIP